MITSRIVNRSSRNFAYTLSGIIPVFHSPSSFNPFPSIRHPIPSQEAGIGLAAPLGLRVSMGGDDELLSDGSPARLTLDYTTKKMGQ
ncbi:hypothetical protein EVAR_29633_1 [Eumeta japonica]|uniref:Uncharacterized protein n=1 Tax=Eumeta variegata TaxID=151549 RepID=A0A4C1W7I5_EUMVA|nr:hypothetical protein EVAR_29633_1 [Eumeta japonica]